jgi:lipopolysaccharide/colanic/teichoic acid biosynthesis glycosyltransferase
MMHDSPAPSVAVTGVIAGSEFYIHQPQHGAQKPIAPAPSFTTAVPQDISVAAPISRYFRVKPTVDRMITAALMIVALPLMIVVAVAVLICDGRPVFFRQVRVGKNGRLFRILKFRTMSRNAERQTGAVWSNATDPRVTRLGRWLRCSHLDELPQFLNVLLGQMNIVGPRPERPEFVQTLAAENSDYLKRIQVRPGITGLAQLRLGYDESVSGISKKVECDLDYIRSTTLWNDIMLLATTLPHIARQLIRKWSQDCERQSKTNSAFEPEATYLVSGRASRRPALETYNHKVGLAVREDVA